jgi:hypothetical protein
MHRRSAVTHEHLLDWLVSSAPDDERWVHSICGDALARLLISAGIGEQIHYRKGAFGRRVGDPVGWVVSSNDLTSTSPVMFLQPDGWGRVEGQEVEYQDPSYVYSTSHLRDLRGWLRSRVGSR